MPTATPPSPLPTTATTTKETRRNLYCLLTTSLISLLFLFSFSSSSSSSTSSTTPLSHHYQKLILQTNPTHSPLTPHSPSPPSIAYFLSASDGDSHRLIRLLFSIYHPRNQYLLHLDLTAPQSQRDQLAVSVQSLPLFRIMQNVNVIGKADFAYPRGSSPISSTLHGAAILLKFSRNWDWFINLSASDYPLLTQDGHYQVSITFYYYFFFLIWMFLFYDILHIMSYIPKDLNFMNHNSYIGWRESRKLKRITVDPGLYLSDKTDMFYATQKRELPNTYRLFTGSSSAILSRKFVEFCIMGSENLPRTVLMYMSNTPSSQANYFPTVLCNAREFNNTVVNHNLQYASWDEPPKQEQRTLGLSDFDKMIQSGAAFGSRFPVDDPVLDRIDREVLNRKPGRIAPGGWCLGEAEEEDPCTVWGETDILRPGPGAKRFEKHIVRLFSNGTFHSQQCIVNDS